MFNIPDGVDELVYDEDLSDDANFAEGPQEFSEGVIEDEVVDDRPPTPRIIGIVSQKIRTLNSGDERVDVVLEVEDIVGVDKYEFRVSKA